WRPHHAGAVPHGTLTERIWSESATRRESWFVLVRATIALKRIFVRVSTRQACARSSGARGPCFPMVRQESAPTPRGITSLRFDLDMTWRTAAPAIEFRGRAHRRRDPC